MYFFFFLFPVWFYKSTRSKSLTFFHVQSRDKRRFNVFGNNKNPLISIWKISRDDYFSIIDIKFINDFVVII